MMSSVVRYLKMERSTSSGNRKIDPFCSTCNSRTSLFRFFRACKDIFSSNLWCDSFLFCTADVLTQSRLNTCHHRPEIVESSDAWWRHLLKFVLVHGSSIAIELASISWCDDHAICTSTNSAVSALEFPHDDFTHTWLNE
jgi:hypothetical protein